MIYYVWNIIEETDLECSPSFKLYWKDRVSNSCGLCARIIFAIPQQRMNELEFNNYEHHIESVIFELINKKDNGI